jgi:hypothetical protein
MLDPDTRTRIEPAARPIESSIAEQQTIVFLDAALYIEPIAELN